MIQTPAAVAISTYPAYVHNCLRNAACEPPYAAPLPTVAHMQLYVDFGQYKPATIEFQLQDACSLDNQEQIFPSNYVVGQTPEGNWYGVFKYSSEPLAPVTAFVIWHSALVEVAVALLGEKTYFSEMLVVEPCLPLTKVKACQPELATVTGFDINGVYYGNPVNVDFLGQSGVRYFHIAWVRLAKVRELTNKATFKSSLIANFRTTVEKIHQLDTELVPKWYKDELLAIYARGVIQIDDLKTWIVSDLAIDPINDDDLTWKPFVQLRETFRLYFGCDASECVECCSPLIGDASTETEHPSESDASASESAGPGDDWSISYTNNLPIPVRLRIHNNGVGALTDIFNGIYSDPLGGTSVLLPAVGALLVFDIVGSGKTFFMVQLNGVANPAAVGADSISWFPVNGPVHINFITNP